MREDKNENRWDKLLQIHTMGRDDSHPAGMIRTQTSTGIRMSRPRTACWSGWQTQG